MSLEDFLSASYALLAEEHQRINPLKDFLSLSREIAPTPARSDSVKTTVAAAQNEQSMAALQGMLQGVQGSPTRKPRRAK